MNFHSVSDKTADVLVGHDVPDPVTGQHQELIQHLVASLYVEFRFRGNCNKDNCQTSESALEIRDQSDVITYRLDVDTEPQ